MREEGEEIEPINEFENSVFVFDNNLGSSNCEYLDQFFRKRHKI